MKGVSFGLWGMSPVGLVVLELCLAADVTVLGGAGADGGCGMAATSSPLMSTLPKKSARSSSVLHALSRASLRSLEGYREKGEAFVRDLGHLQSR